MDNQPVRPDAQATADQTQPAITALNYTPQTATRRLASLSIQVRNNRFSGYRGRLKRLLQFDRKDPIGFEASLLYN